MVYIDASNANIEGLNITDYILDKFVPANVSVPRYTIVYVDNSIESRLSDNHAQLQCSNLIWPFGRCGDYPKKVPIKGVQVLTKAEGGINRKHIVELTIAMEFNTDYYQPGDTIAILPFNDIKEVCQLMRQMQILEQSDNVFQLEIASQCKKNISKQPPYIPTQCTPFQLLRDCLNTHAIPKKQFLSALSNYCVNSKECAFLSCLSSKEGTGFYSKLVLELGFTLWEMLVLCPSCKPTLELLVEHLPRLLPRPYSIANNPLGNEVKIIYSTRAQNPGVTTKMLTTLVSPMLDEINPMDLPKLIAYGRQTNRFRFTAEEAIHRNHILIGVGTAISPFLGFLEMKEKLLTENSNKSLGNTWLIAGAAMEISIPHRGRILGYKESNALQRYFECLSRTQDATYSYVQEQLLALGPELVEFLMQENTIMYVCADGGLISKSIGTGIAQCLAKVNKITFDKAKEVTNAFKRNGKYREDVWL